MMGVLIHYYETRSGIRPVEEYIMELEASEQLPVAAALGDLATKGITGASVTMRRIDGKLWELKITRHRIFYVVLRGPEMVLLHVYKKQGQKAPRRELAVARTRMKEVIDG